MVTSAPPFDKKNCRFRHENMAKYVTVAVVTSDIQVHQKKWDAPQKCQNPSKSSGGKTASPRFKRVDFWSPNPRTRLQGTHDGLVGSEDLLWKRRTCFKGLFWGSFMLS